MRRVLQGRNAPAIALGILALVVAGAGGAYAANSGGGTITACVHKTGGGLYRARHCARHDGKLSWNADPRVAGSHDGLGRRGVPDRRDSSE